MRLVRHARPLHTVASASSSCSPHPLPPRRWSGCRLRLPSLDLEVFFISRDRARLQRFHRGHQALSFHGLSCRQSIAAPASSSKAHSVPTSPPHLWEDFIPASVAPSCSPRGSRCVGCRLSGDGAVDPPKCFDRPSWSFLTSKNGLTRPREVGFRRAPFGHHRFPGCRDGQLQEPCQRARNDGRRVFAAQTGS